LKKWMKKTDVDICHCLSFLFWVYSLDALYPLFYLVVWIDLGIYLQMQDFMVELVHNLNGKSNKQ
jgi:hypothetical protein